MVLVLDRKCTYVNNNHNIYISKVLLGVRSTESLDLETNFSPLIKKTIKISSLFQLLRIPHT